MHLLELYVGKDDEKKQYWISQEEAGSIIEQSNNKNPFIIIPRLDINVNPREIKSFGVPKYISEMKNKGIITFDRNENLYIKEDGYFWEKRWDSDKWNKISGLLFKETKTFEEYIKHLEEMK